MDGTRPVYLLYVFNYRLDPFHLLGKKSFGTNEIDIGHKLIRLQDIRNHRTDDIGEVCQDLHDLAPFVAFQLPDAVVGFDNDFRLNEHSLATGRLVMYDPFDLSFESWSDGDHQTSVAHGRCYVFVDNSFRLCASQDRLQAAGNTAHCRCDLLPDLCQCGRGIIFYFSELIQDGVYFSYQLREDKYISGQSRKCRISDLFILYRTEKADDIVDGL